MTVPSPSQEGHPTGAGYQRPPPLRRHRRRPRPLQPRRGGAAGRPARPTNELGRHANLGLARPGGSHAHDRGAVLRDLVVLLADGGGCVSDLASLREQAGCSGGSARPRPRGGWSGRSPPTLVGWRRCDRRRRPRPPPRRLGLRAVVAGPFGLSTGHPGDLPPRAAHPGARHKMTFTDPDGHRFQVFITNQHDPDIARLEARHRPHLHKGQTLREISRPVTVT